MATKLQVPGVYKYRDRDHHSRLTLAVMAGRSYITHIPMDSKLSLEKTSHYTFETEFVHVQYSPAVAANSFLRSTDYLAITGSARRALEKLAVGSTPTEDDLTEEVEENTVAKKNTETAAAETTEKKARKAKAPKAEAAENTGPRTIGGFDPTAKIKVLIKENPHREGSGRARAFESAKAAKTVADYEGKPKYLAGWVESGHLQIG